MKNLKYILLGLTFLAVACDKKLDIEPQQSVSRKHCAQHRRQRQTRAAWRLRQFQPGRRVRRQSFPRCSSAGSDGEVRWVGTYGDPRDIFNHAMDAGNYDVENTWSQAYAAINACNNVLSALAVVNADDRDRVEGEARFIRATCYYELVRLFGKTYEPGANNTQLGVPLVKEPTRGINDASFVSRATVEEVFQFVHDELHAAYALLPEENDVYANKYVAAAVIARMHLTRGEYDGAFDFAEEVLNSGYYSLLPNYADLWNQDDNTAEAIFTMQVSAQDGDNELVTFFSIPEFGGRDGDIEINQKHLDLYSADDTRLALFYDGAGAKRTGKWRDHYKNIPIIRLGEIYLIAAERQSRMSENADDYYNAVHTRAGRRQNRRYPRRYFARAPSGTSL